LGPPHPPSGPPRPVRLGLVGLGYWGPNLLRAAGDLDDLEITFLCDVDAARLERQRKRYPYTRRTRRFEDMLEDDSLDGVIVATPIGTHRNLVQRALEAGKHVLVEKPMSATASDAREMVALALRRDLTLMPGHTFLYSPPVVKIKELLDSGQLGDLYFVTSTRVNLGIHRSDASVIADLAPHDFSILHYWMGSPLSIRAVARDSVVPGTWDVAFIDLCYPSGTLVRVEISWLAPTKLRRTVLAGSHAMVVYDDTSSEQVRVFDRGVDVVEPRNFGEHQLSYRVGDIVSPRIDTDEPVRVELADFAHSIRTRQQPRSHMLLGLDVVKMVEAAELSLRHNGATVHLNAPAHERRRTPDRRSNGRVIHPVPAAPRFVLGPTSESGRFVLQPADSPAEVKELAHSNNGL
jgi:predicted dehydrogenase